VANGGQMYAFGQDSRWYVWQSGAWALTSAPPPPPPDVSPDGSTISGGTGTLVTAHGTWTFGGPASPGNWLILLNGTVAGGGVASELEVTNGGRMYAFGQDSRWYVWQGGAWTLTSAPPPPPPEGVSRREHYIGGNWHPCDRAWNLDLRSARLSR